MGYRREKRHRRGEAMRVTKPVKWLTRWGPAVYISTNLVRKHIRALVDGSLQHIRGNAAQALESVDSFRTFCVGDKCIIIFLMPS